MNQATGPSTALDASAILAHFHGEPGGARVGALLEGAAISSVNWSEVVQKTLERGVRVEELRENYSALGLTIEPLTVEDAEEAALLWRRTRSHGLSLGDRACIALGRRLGAPVVTADRTWRELGLGVEIETIR